MRSTGIEYRSMDNYILDDQRRERSGLPNYSSVSIINRNIAELELLAA
jgi:hypothetical protein